jgi:Flp pilus assembly protein TadG
MPVTLRILKDDSAVVSIMLAASMLFGIAVAGFAVDYGRAEFAKVELQNALDAGALAGARSSPLTAAQITKEALTYFGANWGAPFGSHVVDGSGNPTQPSFVVDSGITHIIANASINVNTTMLWAIGQKTMLAKAFNVVDLPQTGGVEVALVLDNTGSQAEGCKMNYIVAAAQGFVNQLYGVPNPSMTNVVQPPASSNCSTASAYTIPSYSPPAEVTPPPALWVTIVPFVTSVAPVANSTTAGSNYQNWINNGWLDSFHANEYPANAPWQGCVEARLYTASGDANDPYGGEDSVDTNVAPAIAAWNGNRDTLLGVELAPSQVPFTRYFWPSDNDVMPDTGNPSWAPNKFQQVTSYPLISGTNLTLSNLKTNPPPLSTGGAFLSGGSPNAPYWPAFNVWNNSVVGASPTRFFNDNPAQSQFTLQTFVNGTGNQITVGSGTNNNQTELDSCTTDAPLCSFEPGNNRPFNPSTTVPSNPPAGTYVEGPNVGCPTAMTVMSTDYSKIMTNLAAMFPLPIGGTSTSVGLSWGFRALSPNWQGVWNEGSKSLPNNLNQALPLPYNTVIPNPGGGNIQVNKVVIFMTDGDNQFGSQFSNGTSVGDNNYIAYKTLDHTPLLDQPQFNSAVTQPWTNSTNKPSTMGGVIPPPIPSQANGIMATRAQLASDPPATFNEVAVDGTVTPVTIGGDGQVNSMTAAAWGLCQGMQNDGVIMFTVLLEFNSNDISATTANGYRNYCSTDPNGGTHFFELVGNQVSDLGNVFTSIGNSITSLRLVQ